VVESRAGAPTSGSGGNSVAFALGLSPAPIVTFPAPALRTRRADFRHRALQWDHAPRTRIGENDSGRQVVGLSPTFPGGRCTSLRPALPSRLRRAAEPVDASTASDQYGPTPSLMHGMVPESLPSTRGTGIATPASLLPSPIAPHLRSLSSTGITRRLQSYGPLRHPAGPACPSRGPGGCMRTTDRASRVATIPLFHACRRHYPGGTGRCARRSLPAGGSLPRDVGGSASALQVSRPAQRSLALRPACSLSRPRRPVASECFRPCRYLHHPPRLLPAGATVAGRDSHPLGNGAFPRRTTSDL